MTEHDVDNEIPLSANDDVSTLYSWANMHGSKYRDFSASRQEQRAQVLRRMEEQPTLGEAAVAATEAAALPPDLRDAGPAAAAAASGLPANVDYIRMPAKLTRSVAETIPLGAAVAGAQEKASNGMAPEAQAASPAAPAVRAPEPERSASEPRAATTPASYPPSPDQIGSRWYALRGYVEKAGKQEAQYSEPRTRKIPALAVFSLAGGVGKTSLVATLGRALSAAGERVLLADMSAFGLLPFYYGAQDIRPGLVRTFKLGETGPDAPVHLVSVDTEHPVPAGQADALSDELLRDARGSSRILIDLSTAGGATARRVLALAPMVLVPVVPDVSSVMSLSAVEQFFQGFRDSADRPMHPFYVLNKFEASLPLHLDLREALREKLGDRLLPFVIRRSPDVSEALAEGMTVIDYAPDSPAAEDFRQLARWTRSVAAPTSASFRGPRWSEA